MAFRVRPLEATIRPVRPDDEAFIVALSLRVFRSYARTPALSMRRMVRNRKHEISVAVDGDTRLGFVAIDIEELGRDFGPLKRPSVARLDAIAVRPHAAGQGIGRRLIAHAETLACARRAVSMSLLTSEANTRAQRLFFASGYQMLASFDDVYIGDQRALALFKSL